MAAPFSWGLEIQLVKASSVMASSSQVVPATSKLALAASAATRV
jgi:hypothetical protein